MELFEKFRYCLESFHIIIKIFGGSRTTIPIELLTVFYEKFLFFLFDLFLTLRPQISFLEVEQQRLLVLRGCQRPVE